MTRFDNLSVEATVTKLEEAIIRLAEDDQREPIEIFDSQLRRRQVT
jgi:hypothetical protein